MTHTGKSYPLNTPNVPAERTALAKPSFWTWLKNLFRPTTPIQQVTINISSNQDPNRIATQVFETLQGIAKNAELTLDVRQG